MARNDSRACVRVGWKGGEDVMFLGEYQHTLDAKGRVSLPAKFRAQLPKSVVVSKGLDKCLYVFTVEAFTDFLATLMDGADFDPKKRAVRRFFTAGSMETELDAAGRLTLPGTLREHAGMSKDVAVIGNGERVELWDAETWIAYEGEAAAHIEDNAEGLSETGLF